MLNEVGITWVVQSRSELCGQANAVIELSQQQQPRVGGQWGVGKLDLDRQRVGKKSKSNKGADCKLTMASLAFNKDL